MHFHLGLADPDIRNIKLAMAEVARFYVELRQMGVEVEYVDVGGGLGVDYDGTRSTAHASVNYSIQEYANDIVYSLAEACRENEVPMPHVISRAGRALTAHHALLLINVIDLETQAADDAEEVTEDDAHAGAGAGRHLGDINERTSARCTTTPRSPRSRPSSSSTRRL